jgi:hypothetical protein
MVRKLREVALAGRARRVYLALPLSRPSIMPLLQTSFGAFALLVAKIVHTIYVVCVVCLYRLRFSVRFNCSNIGRHVENVLA